MRGVLTRVCFLGQSILEYAMLIAVVAGALLTMQIYMNRGMQGRMREAADEVGQQFDAEAMEGTHTITRTVTSMEVTQDGATNISTDGTEGSAPEVSTYGGSEVVTTW